MSGLKPAHERWRDVFTIPNILSMTRIACTPPVVWLLAQQDTLRNVLGLVGLLVLGLTDMLDGLLARALGQ